MHRLFICFCCCSFSSKNATNSAAGEAKFVFGQNMSERVLVSPKQSKWKSRTLFNVRSDFNKVVLSCAFRVLRRAIAQMRKTKTFQLPKLQSPHHRKPPKRRVSAPQGMLAVDGFPGVTRLPFSDKREMKARQRLRYLNCTLHFNGGSSWYKSSYHLYVASKCVLLMELRS